MNCDSQHIQSIITYRIWLLLATTITTTGKNNSREHKEQHEPHKVHTLNVNLHIYECWNYGYMSAHVVQCYFRFRFPTDMRKLLAFLLFLFLVADSLCARSPMKLFQMKTVSFFSALPLTAKVLASLALTLELSVDTAQNVSSTLLNWLLTCFIDATTLNAFRSLEMVNKWY